MPQQMGNCVEMGHPGNRVNSELKYVPFSTLGIFGALD